MMQGMTTIQILALWALYALSAFAQEASDACQKVTITHVSQDIPCATVGHLYVDPDLSGNLELRGIVELGSLHLVDNKGLVNLSSTSLSRIDEELEIDTAASLRNIQLPNLTSIWSFSVNDAPKLDGITLGTRETNNITTHMVSVVNTAVTRLNFDLDSVHSIHLIRNIRLGSIESGIRSIESGMFWSNGNRSSVSLPSLVSAGSLSFRHTTAVRLQSLISVNSSLSLMNNEFGDFDYLQIHSLETVGVDLNLINNSNLLNIDFPQLRTVGNSLSIVNNSAAEKINFPQLTQIGGNLTVANDLANVELDGFPLLTNVSEKVVFDGDFKFIELPSLSNAYDGLWVSSSENISFSCAALEKSFQSSRPHQSFECRSAGEVWTSGGDDWASDGDNTKAIDPASTAPGQTQDGEQTLSAPALSGGAIAGIVIGTLAAIGILAAVLFIVWRRRTKEVAAEGRTSTTDSGDHQDPKYTVVPPDELQGVPRSELAMPDPELEGSRVDTIYYEVDGTSRRGA